MKRQKLVNIQELINDPEVDPTIYNNIALSTSLKNYKIFELFKNSPRVDEFANYEENIVKSVYGESCNSVFNYLSKHNEFKNNLTECLEVAVTSNFMIFKEIYNNKLYNEEQKTKDFNKLLELSYLHGRNEPLDFILKNNKHLPVELKNLKFQPMMFNDVLSTMVFDERMMRFFNINEAFESLIKVKNVENLATLSILEVDFDYKEIINLLIKINLLNYSYLTFLY